MPSKSGLKEWCPLQMPGVGRETQLVLSQCWGSPAWEEMLPASFSQSPECRLGSLEDSAQAGLLGQVAGERQLEPMPLGHGV